MLFAEATQADFNTGATFLTCSMAFITALFAWLSGRDRLKFDVEKTEMRLQIKDLTVKTDDCHKDRDKLEQKVNYLMRRDRNPHVNEPTDENP